MFNFLKKKLKETVVKFTKKAEEESEVIEEELSNEVQTSDLKETSLEGTSDVNNSQDDSLTDEVKDALVDKSEELIHLNELTDDKLSKANTLNKESKKSIQKIDEELNVDYSESDSTFKNVDKIIPATDNSSKDNKPQEKITEDVFTTADELSKETTKEELGEIDPLIEEVIEKNKSFQEFEQQVSTSEPDNKSLLTSGSIEEIDNELKNNTIVEDGIEESSAVENLITVDDENIQETSEIKNESEKEKKGFFGRLFSKKYEEKDSIEEEVDELNEELKNDSLEDLEEEFEKDLDNESKQTDQNLELSTSKDAVHKHLLTDDVDDSTKKTKGFFGKIKERVVKFQLTDDVFEDIFWEFELALLESNVASEVIEKIKTDLREQLTNENVSRKEVSDVIFETLKNSLDEILSVPNFDLIEKIKSHKSSGSKRTPFVICVVGVNGTGKTTTIAKLINLFKKNNLTQVVAAADTFRAAAIQQLEEHTTKLDVKLIKHDYNADPAAVAFDAIKHAQAKNLDVVLIDTAGRLQSNSNLMDELKKVVRVNKPDFTLFIGESVTGNDCVEQAIAFNEAVGINGIILSKADIDEKGGAAISVSFVTKKPILYLGTGQTYDDLKPFNKEEMLQTLGL